MFEKFSIRNKLIISIIIGCLIPYLIGCLYVKNKTEEWLYNNYIENTNLSLRQTATHVDEAILKNMSNLVSMIAMDERVINVDFTVNSYIDYNASTFKFNTSKSEKEIMDYFRTIKDSHSIINMISFGTEQGSYVEYPAFKPEGSYDPRTREWYINAINKKDTVISEPYITKMSKDMVISFSRSVILKDKKIGVISLTIKLDDLMKDINGIKYGESRYINILSSNNVFINSPLNKAWILHSVEDLKLNVFSSIDNYNGKSFEGKINASDKVFNVYFSPYSGWKYVSVIDKSEVLKQSKVLTSLLIVIYLIMFLVMLVVIFLISNHITRPIFKITQAINKMATFNFDMYKNRNFEIYTNYNDEIGEISRSLNTMQENFVELKSKIEVMDKEIQNINIEESSLYQLELSEDSPFVGIASSINGLLQKVHNSIEQIRFYNSEISHKNELLEASKEELIVQLEEIDSQNEYIRFIAEHDSLTNLPNRRKFYEKLSDVLANNRAGAVILLDLDNFKSINDTLGHLFGDKVLQYISGKLQEISNFKIFVSRFGGDEFLLLYEGENDVNEIIKFIKQLLVLSNKRFLIDQNEVEIEFSIGISLFPRDSMNIDQLIMNADLALYSIKNSGKNNFAFFNNEMLKHLKFKLDTKNILRKAIENNGFKMVYQPQVDIKSGEIIGYEALVRLKDHKEISPGEFIAVSEEDGTIVTIGRIVTKMVIEQMHKWQQMGFGLKPIAINFSAMQILDYAYKSYLLDLLKSNSISTGLIVIEITETTFLENKEVAIEFLKELRSYGIKIAIDDFGTGYSSLSYLTFLPIDTIKLDRTLSIKFLELENIAVMDSLIALAHSLNMKVIAEGIEEYEQVRRLIVGKCDAIQGYYFSRPLEVEEVERNYGMIYKI
ncbi:EAL domain-containing protein [Clostridium thailandense]|uniref:EAL domain-containing protein n=1 Tax=Clostridium thailandense TaxID=2794346 RepID=UPI003988EE96